MVSLETEERRFFRKARENYHDFVQYNEMDRYYDNHPEKKPAFELWTLRHFLGGTLVGLLIPNRRTEFFAFSIVFEVVEEWLARNVEEWRHASEPFTNKIVDIFFNMFGYETGQLFKERHLSG